MSRTVLLTVSGRIPADLAERVAAGERPRADYVVMSEAFQADLVDVSQALGSTGRLGSLLYRLGGAGPLLGWYCFRRRRQYEVIVSDGEQVGIPLALLGRLFGRGTARHMMIVHILSTPAKSRLVRLTRIAPLVDRYVVYCTWQQEFLRTVLGVSADRVVLSTFMVDTTFFDPDAVPIARERLIATAGLERRDYPTLMQAVRGLDVKVVIAAASPWSTRHDSTRGEAIPENVEVRRLDFLDLRELYARAEIVVMPLEDVTFQAGITTILEAMAMGRAVLCTRTAGQTDTVIDSETGVYVGPHDAEALRAAITSLLSDLPASRRMGDRGREWVIAHADVDRYAEALRREVAALRPAVVPE